jgi:hypothetical protein
MKTLTHYSNLILMGENHKEDVSRIDGLENLSKMLKFFGGNFCFYDRSGNIRSPINNTPLELCKIPEYKEFDKSYEQICDERAVQLMSHAKSTNRKIAVMYSGGIDSTLVLASLFKNCSAGDVKNHVVAFVNHTSIAENASFFYDYIIKRVECIPSYKYVNYIGNDDYMIVSGEQADQLFVVSFALNFASEYGFNALNDTIENRKEETIRYIASRVGDIKTAENVFNTLSLTIPSAPIDVSRVRDFWWWVAFCIMWQGNYVRVLPYAKDITTIKFEENYTTFFSPHDFQHWSMHNRENMMRDNFSTYKFMSKEYIYDYNKDAAYRDGKRKNGSLGSAIKRKVPFTWIDSNMVGHHDFPSDDYFNVNNSFVNW